MENYYVPTLLDVVYAVLEGSDQPLTPYEIEAVAVGAGYDVSAWEAVDEIEAHLDAFGPHSPFVQVGRQRYWLLPGPESFNQSSALFDLFQFLVVAMVLVAIAGLGWLVLSANPLPAQPEVAAPLLVEAVPAPQPSLIKDPAWWAEHAVNQLNLDTQEVSRAYLSNYYNTCGPAAISMVVTFYRSRPAGDGDRVTPADVLRDARSQLGYFEPPYNSGLMTFENLEALAALYGLRQANPDGRGDLLSLDDLLNGVRQGQPAIAGMRYGYSNNLYLPAGGSGIYNHFIVVFGTQQVDGAEHLLVLNNHPGKYLVDDAEVRPELMSLDQFRQSWLLNDGSEDQDLGHAAFFVPDA